MYIKTNLYLFNDMFKVLIHVFKLQHNFIINNLMDIKNNYQRGSKQQDQ